MVFHPVKKNDHACFLVHKKLTSLIERILNPCYHQGKHDVLKHHSVIHFATGAIDFEFAGKYYNDYDIICIHNKRMVLSVPFSVSYPYLQANLCVELALRHFALTKRH